MSKNKGKAAKKTGSEVRAGDQGTRSPFQMADRMARALSEGNLEEFLEKELPGNEKARKLARLMSGWQGESKPETAKCAGGGADHKTGMQPGEACLSDEKEVLDQLGEIASANKLSIDWVVRRALKCYISEYRRTGKL